MLYAQNFNGLVLSFPQDNSIARDGLAHEGENSTLLGLKGLPSLAEELQISRDLFLLEYTGGKLHIPTISTANSVKLIAQAKEKGLDVMELPKISLLHEDIATLTFHADWFTVSCSRDQN